jgi:hypothetical protein
MTASVGPRLAAWAALAACSSISSVVTETKSATVECLHCMPGTAVAANVPLKLRVDWKRCSSLEHACDPDKPPFQIFVSCDAMRCDTVDTGGGYLEVTPTATGTTHVIVRLSDRRYREERLGPIHVAAPTAIDLACTFMRRGSDVREPCADGVAPGSDVHVVMVARAGERVLAHPMPRDVTVDGRPILAGGDAVGASAWECRLSSDSDDRLIPEIRKCVRKNVPPGASWTIEARLPAQRLSNQLRVRVTK